MRCSAQAEPGHRRDDLLPAEVGEDDLLEVDLVELPAGVVDVAVGPHEQRRLPRGVGLADHVVHARDEPRLAPRAGEERGEPRRARRSGPTSCTCACERITRWSQTRSRSATMCEERITVIPVSATASITDCRNSRRASGSSEATGSSSRSSSGRFASASVSATCACWPPESLPTFWRGDRPSCSIRSRASSSSQLGLSFRPSRSVSGDREAAVERVVLRDEADARQHAPASRSGSWPSTRTVPALGRPRPTASCSSVVLPAPFGPTSAVTDPGSSSSEQSCSAQREP